MTALEALADKLRAQALAGELSAPDGVVEVRLERRLVREDRRPCEVGERWRSELATIELHSRAGVVALLRPARGDLVFAFGDESAVAPWLAGWSRVGDRLWRAPT